VHGQFVAPVFYPARMWSPNYFGALAGGGGTYLLVTPAQHRVANVAQGTSTQRRYTNLDLRLFYSGHLGKEALSDAPSIANVDAVREGLDVVFTVQVVGDPAAAIHQAWITWVSDAGTTWSSLDLAQCVAPLPAACGGVEESRTWKGRLATAPASFRFIAQAVSGVGLVAVDDNGGAYHAVGAPVPAAATIAFVSPPSGATVGSTVEVRAKLAFSGTGLAGKTVSIAVGGAIKYATTGPDGVAIVPVALSTVPGSYPLTATFIGDDGLLPASATAAFQVERAPVTLAALAPAGVTLTATVAGKTVALQQESVAFQVNGPNGPATLFAITDHLGRASLPTPALPAGVYSVLSASYAGNAAFATAGLTFVSPQLFNVAKTPQTVNFPVLANVSVGAPPVEAYATASSGLPLAFSVSGPCSVSNNVVVPIGTGSCTVTATQAGDAVYAATSVQRSFTIAAASQAIAFAPAPSGVTVGQPLVTVSASSTNAGGAPSTNPITFSSLTPAICTTGPGANSVDVTLLAVGTCTIAANQAGGTGYNAAPQATQSFPVAASAGPPVTFTVTKLADTNDGACNADCSLREAVLAANAALGPNVVNFTPGLTGTIVLTGGQIQISGPLRIVGPGSSQLTVSGNLASRIFLIGAAFPACPAPDLPGYAVSISGVTLANARRLVADSSGGAIQTQHSLTLNDVVIENSAARAGGAVQFLIQYAGQSLRIANSWFLDNFAGELVAPTADFDLSGGAIYAVERCQNALDTPYTQPVVIAITGSEFRGNSARPLTARDGRGGAIRSWSLADFVITDTIITDNHVDAPNPPVPSFFYVGGGVEGLAKSWRLERVEVSENSANDVTGADVTRGGGLRFHNPAVDRQGPAGRVAVKIVNSTISGNVSTATAGGINIAHNVALELINSTVSDNVAEEARTGGITFSIGDTYPVSGLRTTRPSLTLISSIVANNNGNGGDIAAGVNGGLQTFTVTAFDSLIERLCPPPSCLISVAGAGFLVGVDPLLGALANNGGTSRTHALLPGSQAVNAGSNPFGLATDQRGAGFPRVNGGRADMGAFESP
jgi:CSLREA domain-containing protein